MLPLLTALTADACTCLLLDEADFFPSGSEVPLNVRPLIRPTDPGVAVRLQTADGQVVPTTERRWQEQSRTLIALTPAALLAPETSYTLVAGEHEEVFETGSRVDTAAPGDGALAKWRWEGEKLDSELLSFGYCLDEGVWLEFDPVLDDSAVAFQAEVSLQEDFQDATPITWLPGDDRFIGTFGCPPDTFSGLTPGETLYFRTRMLDGAGNHTTWSRTVSTRTGYAPYFWIAGDDSREDHLYFVLLVSFLSLLGVLCTGLYDRRTARILRRVRYH